MARFPVYWAIALAATAVWQLGGSAQSAEPLTPTTRAAIGLDQSGQLRAVITEMLAPPAGEAAKTVDTSAAESKAAAQTEGVDAASWKAQQVAVGRSELIRERYSNRAVKIERQVVQDAQDNFVNHGKWKMWDPQGNLIAEGQFVNGERDGTWHRWYRDGSAKLFTTYPYNRFVGPFISQATFRDGELHGKWVIYDSKQRKISEWEFAEGERHGTSMTWYPTGRKMRQVEYREGDIHGQLMEWSADSKLTTKDTYQEGRKLAQKVTYHGGTVKKSEGIYLFAKTVVKTPDDWWNARPATYTQQGKDEKHGKWTEWYPNGQLKLQGEYEHNAQVGQFSWWHANGQKSAAGPFESGERAGQWTWWHSNGQKSIQGEYATGGPTGQWIWWKQDGKVAQKANFSASKGRVVESPRPRPEAPRASNRIRFPAPR